MHSKEIRIFVDDDGHPSYQAVDGNELRFKITYPDGYHEHDVVPSGRYRYWVNAEDMDKGAYKFETDNEIVEIVWNGSSWVDMSAHERCSQMICPAGSHRVADAADKLCYASPCLSALPIDIGTCCKDNQKCQDVCQGEYVVAGGKADAVCDDATCSPAEEDRCCMRLHAKCSADVCSSGWRLQDSPGDCEGPVCTETTDKLICCEAQPNADVVSLAMGKLDSPAVAKMFCSELSACLGFAVDKLNPPVGGSLSSTLTIVMQPDEAKSLAVLFQSGDGSNPNWNVVHCFQKTLSRSLGEGLQPDDISILDVYLLDESPRHRTFTKAQVSFCMLDACNSIPWYLPVIFMTVLGGILVIFSLGRRRRSHDSDGIVGPPQVLIIEQAPVHGFVQYVMVDNRPMQTWSAPTEEVLGRERSGLPAGRSSALSTASLATTRPLMWPERTR
mmetsp:Transcript_7989/g.18858  ORF Transcript_7989/g.18858 Transcript_7989/m.18858 type:complete len:444 (-) Transcript_7989:38-1369(-)